MSNSSPESQGNGASTEESPSIIEASLLDGSEPAQIELSSEAESRRRVVADPNVPLAIRLETFEDLIDSEIGDTTLARARNLEREKDLRQIYLKFDGGNPSGTQKDRIAFAQSLDALRRGFPGITVATCGNYGVAAALATSLAGLRCVIFIPDGYRTKRISEMEAYGAEIRRAPGDYETAVIASRAFAAENELYDANPGGENTTLQMRAYAEIAHEIYDELRDAPAAVAVPVSNGTTLAGIHRGFLSLYRRGKTSRIPRMVAGSSVGKNPIVQAYLKGLNHCSDLERHRIRETRINEPLINWHAEDGDVALNAVNSTHGWAAPATDRAMTTLARLIREREGLSVLPASTAGLLALLDGHAKSPLPGDRYVAVLTGRKA